MMDSTYYWQLHVKHQQNTYWTLPIDYNNQSYCWFRDSHQSSLFEPKQVFLLHISTKVTCTNMSLNHSDSWHLVSQTCFHCKTYCASLSVPLVMQYCKWKKPLQCRFWHILACVYSLFLCHFSKFQKFKKVVLGFNIT